MVKHTIALLPIGVMTGLISSVPIGPINVTLIATALRRERRRGLAMVLAVALVDGLYAFAFVSALNLFHLSFRLHTMIELIGAVILVAYGSSLAFTGNSVPLIPEQTLPLSARREWILGVLTGVALYISNPALLVFWLAVVGILHSWISSISPVANRVVFSAGVMFGTASWFGMLLYGVQTTSARISLVALRRLSIVLGCVLVGFGGHLLMKYLGRIW